MANVFAVKSGNWSDPTVWNTGSLPTTDDDVYANNFIIDIDTSSTVLSVRSTSATEISAGGQFIPLNGITLNATSSGFISSNSSFISFTLSSPDSATLIGNFFLAPTVTSIVHSGSGTLNLQGNITRPVGAGRNNGFGGGSVRNNGIGTINIVGDLSAGNTDYLGSHIVNASGGRINITGNVFARYTFEFYPVNNIGTGQIVITGSAFGPSVQGEAFTAAAIRNSSSGQVIFIGTSFGGTILNGFAPALINAGTGTMTHIGPDTTATINPAIHSNVGAGSCFLTGPFIGTFQGNQANTTYRWSWYSDEIPTYMTAAYRPDQGEGGGYKNLFTADNVTISNQPSPEDVRNGVKYGPNSELSGTLPVPLPSQVLEGTSVDDTVGTAGNSAVWSAPMSVIGQPGTIGERLKNTATVASVGSQITALGS
jgi:hypothetical protein